MFILKIFKYFINHFSVFGFQFLEKCYLEVFIASLKCEDSNSE